MLADMKGLHPTVGRLFRVVASRKLPDNVRSPVAPPNQDGGVGYDGSGEVLHESSLAEKPWGSKIEGNYFGGSVLKVVRVWLEMFRKGGNFYRLRNPYGGTATQRPGSGGHKNGMFATLS